MKGSLDRIDGQGYLDLFFGNEPNWMYPASPTGRRKGPPRPALASPGIPKT